MVVARYRFTAPGMTASTPKTMAAVALWGVGGGPQTQQAAQHVRHSAHHEQDYHEDREGDGQGGGKPEWKENPMLMPPAVRGRMPTTIVMTERMREISFMNSSCGQSSASTAPGRVAGSPTASSTVLPAWRITASSSRGTAAGA